MKLHVCRKQPSSRMCLVCGRDNPHGLFTAFYELENGELASLVTAREEHQGYPGRLHGGIITALLDETIGRAIMMKYRDNVWGVTVEFSARFLKPVPLNTELRVIGRVVKDEGRLFEGAGELLLPNGVVAATGVGKYVKLPIERIASADADALEWRVTEQPGDPREIDVP